MGISGIDSSAVQACGRLKAKARVKNEKNGSGVACGQGCVEEKTRQWQWQRQLCCNGKGM